MNTKLSRETVIRDPIHEYIRIQDSIVLECIDTKEFQKLRRIHQLGGTYHVFPTGEHTRFSHSLGVYQIIRRMILEVDDVNKALTEREKLVMMLAGLLHDIGHGPFSHVFESVTHLRHEEYSIKIIVGDSDVNKVLNSYDPTIAREIAQVIQKIHPNKLLNQMLSSEFDADRMDYLLRDSYFTGTTYGQYDIERILRTIRVIDQKLVIKESGVHSIENYIMARYHMYWQVYYHPTSRSYEILLTNIFKRAKKLSKSDSTYLDKYPMFKAIFEEREMTLEEYYFLDESSCLYGFLLMSKDEDEILSDLSKRLFSRNLFGYTENTEDKYRKIESILTKKGYDSKYYLRSDKTTKRPYRPYYKDKEDVIWILTKDNQVKEISEVSVIVKALAYSEEKEDSLLFYPKEIEEELKWTNN